MKLYKHNQNLKKDFMLANKMKIKDLEMQKKIEAQRIYNQNNQKPGSKGSERSE